MKKILFILGGFLAVLSIGAFTVTQANPSYFKPIKASATATSTRAYLSEGTATTTLTWDTQEDGTGPIDSAVLAVQMDASTTNSVLDWYVQYSQDNIDWYDDQLNDMATTSAQFSVGNPKSYRLAFSSSTPEKTSPAGTNRANKVVTISTPMRYVRAIFVVPVIATGNASSSGLYAAFIGKNQNR